MARGDELDYVVKAFIVQQLACFVQPTEVAKAVKAEFDIEVTRQRVHYYDLTRKPAAVVDPGLRTLFDTTREEFRERITNIRIANKAAQLEALERMLVLAEERKQIPMVIALVEAAAKIAGTVTHKHELTGKNGVPLMPPAQVTIFQLPDNGRG